jgi:hypothetical protein
MQGFLRRLLLRVLYQRISRSSLRYFILTVLYLNNASYANIGHCFCKECIDKVKRTPPAKCPQCRNIINAEDVKPIHITLVDQPLDPAAAPSDSELLAKTVALANSVNEVLEDVDVDIALDSDLEGTRARVRDAKNGIERVANDVRKRHGDGSAVVRPQAPFTSLHIFDIFPTFSGRNAS